MVEEVLKQGEMMKYRKKPVVIEAMQIPQPNDIEGHGRIWGWFYVNKFEDFKVTDEKGYDLKTLEGVLHALPGDWIIRGVKGEFYSCRNEIFEMTYEKAE